MHQQLHACADHVRKLRSQHVLSESEAEFFLVQVSEALAGRTESEWVLAIAGEFTRSCVLERSPAHVAAA